jgi:hypothetical protein
VTLLVAFKTPRVDCGFHEKMSPEEVINHYTEKSMELTTVIDLTNSDRYYQKADFESRKVNHYKLPQVGKEAPTEKACE